MPLLRPEDYLQIQTTIQRTLPPNDLPTIDRLFGRSAFITLVRIPPSGPFSTSTYIAMGDDARIIKNENPHMTLKDTDSVPDCQIQFGSAILDNVLATLNNRGFRVIIVDAPNYLWRG